MQSRKTHLLAGATMLALLALIANIDAADVGVCEIVAKPASFDHETVTLQGMVTPLRKPLRAVVTITRHSSYKIRADAVR